MLLNLDPVFRLLDAGPVPDEARTAILAARRAALMARFTEVGQILRGLRSRTASNGAPELFACVSLELARLPHGRLHLPRWRSLQSFIIEMDRLQIPEPVRTIVLALARSERELLGVRRAQQLGAERELSLNRLSAIGVLGRRHPVVGVLNLQFGSVLHALRKDALALEQLHEALGCFNGPDGKPDPRYRHEWSDVLLQMAEVAIDLGFLDHADRLLQQVLFAKDARRSTCTEDGAVERSGICLFDGPDATWMTDRAGLAKAHGVQGKLLYHQGRFHEALQAYQADLQLAPGSRERGLFLNRTAQVYLDDGAYRLAEQAFDSNLKVDGDRPSLTNIVAHAGLARTLLLRSMPPDPLHEQDTPRRRMLRDEARRHAEEHLGKAHSQLDVLRGVGAADSDRPRQSQALIDWRMRLSAIQAVYDAHRLIDSHSFRAAGEFEELRKNLLQIAERMQRNHPTFAGGLLWDLVRLEVWAWAMHHRHFSSDSNASSAGIVSPALDRMLELWERQGARERILQVQRWCEEIDHQDGLRKMLNRYLPQLATTDEIENCSDKTILFADIRDSCLHSRTFEEATEVARLVADLFRAINPIVGDWGGRILRYEGDSILTMFEGSTDGGSHQSRAVCCALATQQTVKQLNVFRDACHPGCKPLELAIGIHTGSVVVANLMIPGRREISVYGNAVNLAKRIQELPRSHPKLIEEVVRPGKDRPLGMIVATDDTLSNVGRGVFREFPLKEWPTLKGFEDTRVRASLLLPAVPFRTSFVGMGSVLKPQPDIVYFDVGNEATTGVVDHHQPGVEGSAASLLLDHPDWLFDAGDPRTIEMVVHAMPDFDCCAALLLAAELIEGRATTGSEKRRTILRQLAEYSTQIDHGTIVLENDVDPACSPYAMLSAAAQMIVERARVEKLSAIEVDRLIVERGVQILHAAVQSMERGGPDVTFDAALRDGIPACLQSEAARTREDFRNYVDRDCGRIRRKTFAIPRRDGSRSCRQECAIIASPASALFKVWARREGFSMLVVQLPMGSIPCPQNGGIPLSRFVISVLPDSGLSLEQIGKRLDDEETLRRQALSDSTGVDVVRRGPPRATFENSDPWYDGRAPVLAYTIVDAPRQGSVLSLEEVLASLELLYGSRPAATTAAH